MNLNRLILPTLRWLVPAALLLFCGSLMITHAGADKKTDKKAGTPAEKKGAAEQPRPYGIDKHVPWTTSSLVGTPEPPPPYTTQRAFADLKFKGPVFIAQEPGTDRMMVGELEGKIFAFDRKNPKEKTLYLDTSRQMYAFSFHPDYEKNGQIFVFSPRDPKHKSDPKEKDKSKEPQSRVSRFTAVRPKKGEPRSCDPKSEEVIIEWLAGGHNGGEAIIGPDGYLYICTGDQTSTYDGNATGQGVDDLLAVMMRLDLNHPEKGKKYGIPRDNPFVGVPGARPEIWAFGFRNPWRMCFDERTGDLWVGDVGQDLWEMIRRVERAGNYGWSVQEGSQPFLSERKIGPGPISPPIIEHHHAECRSITGGYVYYGKKFPELNGVYFYGDYEYGKIWGIRYEPKEAGKAKKSLQGKYAGYTIHSPDITWYQELADTPLRIASFGVSRDGDIYLLDHPSGEIHELVRAPATKTTHPFPRKLSETGLFTSVAQQTPSPGVYPYSVNFPQWLDGATAEHFVGLPKDTDITPSAAAVGAWRFDDSTVLAQTISMEMTPGQPQSRRKLETRVLIMQQNHWLGYSYQWNDAQTDATLVDGLGKDIVLKINEAGGMRQQTWHVPSRNECMFCHSRASNFVLGLRTAQVNCDHNYGNIVDNQLRAFSHAGIFKSPLVEQGLNSKAKKAGPRDKKPADLPAFPTAATPDNLAERARAYLHVNCSVCHIGDGGGNSKFQVGFGNNIASADLLDETPLHGTFALPGGKLIAPGNPYASVLLYRFSKLGRGHMPHVGSKMIDGNGLTLLHDWIASLDARGATTIKSPPADFTKMVKTLDQIQQMPVGSRAGELNKLLASPRQAFVLACVLAKEQVPAGVRAELIATGVKQSAAEVRDLFERFIPEQQRTRLLGEFIRPEEILAMKGDVERGKQFFFAGSASLCRNCHSIAGKGGKLGPDLAGIGKKYKSHDILESLLQPSKKIEPKYLTHVLATTAGKVLTGIVLEKSATDLTLGVFEGGEAKTLRIPLANVEQLLPQQKSMMPDGLLRDLTPQQAADLLTFLSSLN